MTQTAGFKYHTVTLNGRHYNAVVGEGGISITGGQLDDRWRGDSSDFVNHVADTFDRVFPQVCENLSISDLSASRAMAHISFSLTILDGGEPDVRITPHGVYANGWDASELDDLLTLVQESALSEQWVRDQIVNAAHYNRTGK